MKNKRILLVDDEITVLFAYKKVLQRIGLAVDTADTEKDALSLLDRHTYDIAILDLRLGGGNCQEGLDLISTVKAKSSKTKVMLITAYGDQEIQEKACRLGADFYFEKPISTRLIQESLRLAGIQIDNGEASKDFREPA